MKRLLASLIIIFAITLSANAQRVRNPVGEREQAGMVKIQLVDGRTLYGAATANIYEPRGGNATLQGEMQIIVEPLLLASIKSESAFNWSAIKTVESGGIIIDGEHIAAIFIIDGFGTVSFLPAVGLEGGIHEEFELDTTKKSVTIDGDSGILKIRIEDPQN